MKDAHKAAGLLVSGGVCFAVMGGFVKHASATLPSLEVSFFRSFLNLLFLVPWMLYQRIPFVGVNQRLLFTRSVLGCVAMALGFYAAAEIALVDATILQKTSVLFTPFVAWLALKETLRTNIIAWSLVALVGSTLVLKPTLDVSLWGGIAALGSGLCGSMAVVSIRRLNLSENPFTIVFSFCFVASVLLGVASFSIFRIPSIDEWRSLLAIGVCGTAGQALLTHALRHAQASFLAPFSLVEVLSAGIVGMIAFHEVPDRYSLMGALLIIISAIAALRAGTPPAARPASPPQR